MAMRGTGPTLMLLVWDMLGCRTVPLEQGTAGTVELVLWET